MARITDPAIVQQLEAATSGKGGGGGVADSPAKRMGLTPTQYSKARAVLSAMSVVEPQLDRVESLYKNDFKGDPTGTGGLMEYLPTPKAKRFDTASGAILPVIRQALSTSAKDGDSDRELATWERLLPGSKEFDATNEERIRSLRRMIASSRSNYSAMIGQKPPPERQPPRTADPSKMSDEQLLKALGAR